MALSYLKERAIVQGLLAQIILLPSKLIELKLKVS
ncbi:hypothetical protein VCR15J5_620149 [Vibrio crassostreae]|nr:hypothetical protein VCR15J5_620149 [Vibrio crassostreae]